MPSFSPQASAGNHVRQRRRVGIPDHVETTTNSQPRSAAFTLSASGRLTTGLVAMIHTALMRPSWMRSNISTAFGPWLVAIAGLSQNCCTAVRPATFSTSMCAASVLTKPPTSLPPMALGWPVIENGPAPG
jgi:hypothetical protein